MKSSSRKPLSLFCDLLEKIEIKVCVWGGGSVSVSEGGLSASPVRPAPQSECECE